jgi:outer membrane protein assembly factor BamA
MFEKLFLEGRPSIAVGVTNNGDVFGGTQLSMSDVLGDHRIDFTIGAVMQYTTFAASYMSMARRFQWAVQGVYQKLFYYGNNPYFYDPLLQPYLSRSMAEATRTVAGGSVFGIYPLDVYRRVEVSAGYIHQSDSYNDQLTADLAALYPGSAAFNVSGSLLPLSVSFVQETTVFREFGPLAGNTMRVAYEASPRIGSILSRQTIDTDFRYYQRLAGTGVLALRLRAFKSTGDYPEYMYFGGMSDMRGYDYLEFVGQNVAFANAELRFPIIEAMLTPIGVMGGMRGVFFFDIGAGWFNNQGFKFAATGTETVQRQSGVGVDVDGNLVPIFDNPVTVSGFRLQDARASFGIGLETFIIGLPLHFDWAWRTTFNRGWEEYLYGAQGASDWRKARFSFWIGYDF